MRHRLAQDISASTWVRLGAPVLALVCSSIACAQSAAGMKLAVQVVKPDRILFAHMGGNDCPPCVVWRATEYPKLQKSATFSAVHYSYVTKHIKSPVPSAAFLPDELKPLKDKLDYASGGRSGSPHQVILVDGAVYDYWMGPDDASEIEAKIAAIVGGTAYPGERCTRRAKAGSYKLCLEPH